MLLVRSLCLVLLALCSGPVAAQMRWESDEATAFARAKAEGRFVLLYLEAVWCHWCHVMDHETYTDAAVQRAIAEHYVPLRIDQDARPDLAARYKDYGWPATIVFAADGGEIVKRQGYIAARPMQRLLAAIVADPSAESLPRTDQAEASASQLSPALRSQLQQRHRDSFDTALGGLRIAQKYLDRDSVEYALTRGAAGDAEELARARKTLDAALALIDPVWGGVYQYSTGADWQHPHFEKLAGLQGEYLRIYALAFAATGEARYRDAITAIRRYVDAFLASPEGGWYVSQDADRVPGEHSAEYFSLGDAQRRQLGVPRVDRNRYARDAGLLIEGLAFWAELSGDAEALAQARAGAEWALRERRLPNGGFRHAESDRGGPYLADNLAMGRGLLQLYRSTAERRWLREAIAAMAVIGQLKSRSGFVSAPSVGVIAPAAQIDENIGVGRLANALFRYSGDPALRAEAEHAMGYLANPKIALSRLTEAGILLLDDELGSDPLHLTVLGAKADAEAAALFEAASRLPVAYKRLEWWDVAEGPLPNPDVQYPPQKKPAVFVCTDRRCSLPLRSAAALSKYLLEQENPEP